MGVTLICGCNRDYLQVALEEPCTHLVKPPRARPGPQPSAGHGSYARYKRGCRCPRCTATHTQYWRDRRRAKRNTNDDG